MGCISSKSVKAAAASPVHRYPTATAPATAGNGSLTLDPSSRNQSATALDHDRKGEDKPEDRGRELRKSKKESSQGKGSFSFRLGFSQRYVEAEQAAAGWPSWLSSAAGEAIQGWVPLRADSFEKLEKVGDCSLFFISSFSFSGACMILHFCCPQTNKKVLYNFTLKATKFHTLFVTVFILPVF